MIDPKSNPQASSDESEETATSGSDASWWSRVEPHERRAVGWATAWFFFLLLGYFIVRPVRETMGTIGGTRQLEYLFLATFSATIVAVPIYSALAARLPRRWLVRVVFHFFAVSLLGFCLLMQSSSSDVQTWTARAFFVWVSLFGIFQTSVFWTVLADLFSSSQARRLFGLIAAGGTAGAIAGSFLTSQLANRLSTDMLLLLPAFIIELGLFFAWRLERCAGTIQKQKSESGDQEASVTGQPTEGGLLSGITHVMHSPYLAMICLFLFFVQMFGTQLYFEQAEIVRASIDQDQLEKRIQLFADIDFYANLLTLLVQSLVAGVILRRFGVSVALVILPIVYSLGFISLALSPTLAVLVVTMVAARTAAYGITVPTREVLFTVVSREDKYKSKNFIDTVVYRGGDALSAKVMGTLTGRMGFGFQSLNLFALPLIAIWGAAAWQLGRRQKKLAELQRRNS